MRIRNLLASLVFVLVLTCVFCIAFAETGNSTYVLDEIEICIDIPSDYIVFTRDTASDDPYLAAIGLSKEDLLNDMQAHQRYFIAFDKDWTFEIMVKSQDSVAPDFNSLDDGTLTTIVSSLESGYASQGVCIEKYEFFQSNQARFIKFYISPSEATDGNYVIQYLAVCNDRQTFVEMRSWTGEISAENVAAFDSIVNSIRFGVDTENTTSADASNTTSDNTSDTTYVLDDVGMRIEIPSEYMAFTRDISNDDPNLAALGLTKEYVLDWMQSGNNYLLAWDERINFEIRVGVYDSEIEDYNLLSDEELASVVSYMKNGYESQDVDIEKNEVFQNEQAKFIKFYIAPSDGTNVGYAIEYSTVYDYKEISIVMYSYAGKLDSEKESTFESIVNSIHFE